MSSPTRHSPCHARPERRAADITSALALTALCAAIASALPVQAAPLASALPTGGSATAAASSASSPQTTTPALEGKRYAVGDRLQVVSNLPRFFRNQPLTATVIVPAFPGVQSIGIRYRGSKTKGKIKLALNVYNNDEYQAAFTSKKWGAVYPSPRVSPFELPGQTDDAWHTTFVPVNLFAAGNRVELVLDKSQDATDAAIDYFWLTSGSADNAGVPTRKPSPYNLAGTGVVWKPEMVVMRRVDGASLSSAKPCNGGDCALSVTFSASAPASAAALQSIVVGSVINSDLDPSLAGPVLKVSKVVSKSANTITVEGMPYQVMDLIESGELSLGAIPGAGGLSAQQGIEDAFTAAAALPPVQVASLEPKRQFALAMDALRQKPLPSLGLQDLIRPAQAVTLTPPTFSIGPVIDKNGIGVQVTSLKFGLGSDCDLGKLAGERGIDVKDKDGKSTAAGHFLGYDASTYHEDNDNYKDTFAQCAAVKIDGTINKLLVQGKLDVSHLAVRSTGVQVSSIAPSFEPTWEVKGAMSFSPNLALDAEVAASVSGVREFAVTYEKGFRFVVPPGVPVFGTLQLSAKKGFDISGTISKFSLKASHSGTAVADFDKGSLTYHTSAGTFTPKLILAAEASASSYVGIGATVTLGKLEDKLSSDFAKFIDGLVPNPVKGAALAATKGVVRIGVSPKVTLLKGTVKNVQDEKTATFAIQTGASASAKVDFPALNALRIGLGPSLSLDLGSVNTLSLGCNYKKMTAEKVLTQYQWSITNLYNFPNCRDLLENPL